MKEDKKSAFTLVELIIGVFIIVILGFIGATSYLQKVDTLRDSARVATVGEIYGAMDVYKLKENLPLGGQDKMIEIYSSGTLVGYQGDIDETLLQTIGYNGKGVDPKSDEPYTFLYTRNKQNAQILLFLENNDSAQKFNSQLFGEEASANEIIPFVFGKKLGVYTDMNKQPIQRTLGNATFDITTATESYNSHYAGDTYSTGTGAFLKKNTYVLTQGGLQYTSCLDALDSDASLRNKNGVYTIEDQNRQPQSVYCDMTREGGGWSLVLKADGTLDTFQYSESIWENTNTLNPENYSYDHQEFKSELFSTQAFTEMMIELDTAGDKRTLIVPTSANSMHELMNAG
ncbi:MAG: hypothetical protein GY828_01630, partial [Candidatus Gracilibacteria bacterium]|nr:hypothetical protein [Candidatus Gracilibacteria bacterium]